MHSCAAFHMPLAFKVTYIATYPMRSHVISTELCPLHRKLRSTTHGKLLLNLCFALLCVYLTLIFADVLHEYRIPCAVTAVCLHYFVLVMGLAMVAQAIILYLKLVKVFGSEPRYYPLKSAIVSWCKW